MKQKMREDGADTSRIDAECSKCTQEWDNRPLEMRFEDLEDEVEDLSKALEQMQESLDRLSGVSLLEAENGESAGTATYIGIAAATFVATYAGLFVTANCRKGS